MCILLFLKGDNYVLSQGVKPWYMLLQMFFFIFFYRFLYPF